MVLLLDKPAFLSNYSLLGLSHTFFSGYDPLVGLINYCLFKHLLRPPCPVTILCTPTLTLQLPLPTAKGSCDIESADHPGESPYLVSTVSHLLNSVCNFSSSWSRNLK